jgi:hypothetical protein
MAARTEVLLGDSPDDLGAEPHGRTSPAQKERISVISQD